MENHGEDCPCKRKRVSENTLVDQETGMLVDIRQQRDTTAGSGGLSSYQGQINIPGPSGDAGLRLERKKFERHSEENGAFLRVVEIDNKIQSTCYGPAIERNQHRENVFANSSTAGNQLVESEIANSRFQLNAENQLGARPAGSSIQTDAETQYGQRLFSGSQQIINHSGASSSEVRIRSSRPLNSRTCEYVQNIQAVAENSYRKTRSDLCFVTEKVKTDSAKAGNLIRSHDPPEDNIDVHKDEIAVIEDSAKSRNLSSSHGPREDNLDVHKDEKALNEETTTDLMFLKEGLDRSHATEVSCAGNMSTFDKQLKGRIDKKFDQGLYSLLNMTTREKVDKEGKLASEGDNATDREWDFLESPYNLEDSGFIEMFSNSVMSSVIRAGAHPATRKVSEKDGNVIEKPNEDKAVPIESVAEHAEQAGKECKFGELGNLLDDVRTSEGRVAYDYKCEKASTSTSSITLSDVLDSVVGNAESRLVIGANQTNDNNSKTSENGLEIAKSAINQFFGANLSVATAQPIKNDNQPDRIFFQINFDHTSETVNDGNINYLPTVILVHIFRYLTIFDLLCRASQVCKLWYNLCRDPDIWRGLGLVNQHRLRNEDLVKMVRYSDYRVRSINLTDCRFITSEGIKHLVTTCRQIESLKVMRCFDITDAAFEGLRRNNGCKNLKTLYLDGCCRVTDKTVLELAESCPLLADLHLNQCTRITDAGLSELAKKCSQLVSLQLDHCSQVTDEAIAEIVMGCPNMKLLNLMSCGITDKGVRYLSKLPKLTNVDLSNIVRLTSDGVVYMSRYCKNLECINISLNSVMDDRCIGQLGENLPGLKKLYCVSCSISDKGLEDIANYCKSLVALDVGWCQEVTDHGVRVISLGCKQLEYFGLIRCDRVTIETIEELVFRYPRINYSTFILESMRLLERARREGFMFGLSK